MYLFKNALIFEWQFQLTKSSNKKRRLIFSYESQFTHLSAFLCTIYVFHPRPIIAKFAKPTNNSQSYFPYLLYQQIEAKKKFNNFYRSSPISTCVSLSHLQIPPPSHQQWRRRVGGPPIAVGGGHFSKEAALTVCVFAVQNLIKRKGWLWCSRRVWFVNFFCFVPSVSVASSCSCCNGAFSNCFE